MQTIDHLIIKDAPSKKLVGYFVWKQICGLFFGPQSILFSLISFVNNLPIILLMGSTCPIPYG